MTSDRSKAEKGNTLRFHIAQAFALLGAEAAPARDLLLEALMNEDTPVGTRRYVAIALGNEKAPGSSPGAPIV
jgi:hypothetical protein